MKTATFALVADLAILRAHAGNGSGLPFGLFGRSGGYGRDRASLVAAIIAGDLDAAQLHFAALVAESRHEYLTEYAAEYPGGFAKNTLDYFANYESAPTYLAIA